MMNKRNSSERISIEICFRNRLYAFSLFFFAEQKQNRVLIS